MNSIFPRPIDRTTKADLVLWDGIIITVDDGDTKKRGSVAVKDGKITEIGKNDEITQRIGSSTVVVNLHPKDETQFAVTPGIIDGHLHLMLAGEQDRLYVNLQPLQVPPVLTQDDVNDRLEAAILNHSPPPRNGWLEGYGYRFGLEPRWPDKYSLKKLDKYELSIFLTSADGHYGSCNQNALDEAGIDHAFEDPDVGGVIQRIKDRPDLWEDGVCPTDPVIANEPTGVFLNHPAMNLVRQKIPPHSAEEYKQCLHNAYQRFIEAGITSYHDPLVGGSERYTAYEEIDGEADNCEMPTSVYYMSETLAAANEALNTVYPQVEKHEWNRVKFAGWKLQTDGTYVTAFTYDPHCGITYDIPNWRKLSLKAAVLALHRTGRQVKVHCVGDKAIDWIIDAIEDAMKEARQYRSNPRHLLEHLILPTEAALKKIAQLGIIVSCQPVFIYTGAQDLIDLYDYDCQDPDYDPEDRNTWRLLKARDPPHRRSERIKPLRTLLNMGIKVCINTDYPSAKFFRPQVTLYSAVTRKDMHGKPFYPEQCISIQKALRCYTINGAYAAFDEHNRGSIEVGKQADFTVWSDDLYEIGEKEPDRLLDVEVEMTIIGGVVKYQKKGSPIRIETGRVPE